MKRITPYLATLLVLPGGLRAQGKRQNIVTPEYTYKVVHVFPHDTSAFTQGLAYRNGFLYEGTGLNGHSSVRKIRLETGEVIKKKDLPADLFGEGITIFRDEIIQLTWLSHKGFVYDLNNFTLKTTFSYSGEGWGLTTDGHVLFMSDGTSTIRVLDPETFHERRHIKVSDAGERVAELNELEFVEGELLANVWRTDRIARISPQNGNVLGWINLSGLLSPMYQRGAEAALNGISYDSRRRRLLVTGKLWPSIFEIRIVRSRHVRTKQRSLVNLDKRAPFQQGALTHDVRQTLIRSKTKGGP